MSGGKDRRRDDSIEDLRGLRTQGYTCGRDVDGSASYIEGQGERRELSVEERYPKYHRVVHHEVASHKGGRSSGVHDQIEKGNVEILCHELESAPMDGLSAAAVDIDRALHNGKEKESLQYTRFPDSADGEPIRSYR